MNSEVQQQPSAAYLERFDPHGRVDHMATEHLARYRWACEFLPRRRALDCSCGPGYGTAMLADAGAAHVIGVDIAPDAIADAQRMYPRPNIEYHNIDAYQLRPETLGTFDLITSLETIEHVTEPERLLDVFAALLNEDGVLLLSCPNEGVQGAGNPFHVWSADLERLRGWLQQRFAYVAEFSEIHSLGTTIAQTSAVGPQAGAARLAWLDSLPTERAPGFLFACAPRTLPKLPVPVGVHLAGGFDYVRKLVEGNSWQRAQIENWQRAVDQSRQTESELREWIARVEEARNWAEGQRQNWEKTANWYKTHLEMAEKKVAELEQKIAAQQAKTSGR